MVHVIIWFASNGNSLARSFTGFDSLDLISSDVGIVKWIADNNIPPLAHEDSYHYQNNDPLYDPQTEYLLTEKQSALFLLRFK